MEGIRRKFSPSINDRLLASKIWLRFSRSSTLTFASRKGCALKLLSFLYLQFQIFQLSNISFLSSTFDSRRVEFARNCTRIFLYNSTQLQLQHLALFINFLLRRIGDAWKFINWADLVVPIGGDGTFLLASKLITDNTKPMFGINPSVSNGGNIFTLPAKYTTDTESIFERLYAGRYTLLMRSRIRTVMNGEGLYRRPFHIHEKSRTQGEETAEWVHYRKVILSLSFWSAFVLSGNQYVHFYSLLLRCGVTAGKFSLFLRHNSTSIFLRVYFRSQDVL